METPLIIDGSNRTAAPTGGAVLNRVARAAAKAPKRILAAAALVVVACAIFGLPVTKELSAGGFTDPASESARAAEVLASKFGQSEVQLLITVTSDGGVHSPGSAQAAAHVLAVLKSSPMSSA